MSSPPDTIVAIATPPGRGGIGIVRLSGQDARRIGDALLRLRSKLAPGRARFGHLIDPTGATETALDEVVATFFARSHSYTGDDVLEIATHGAPVVLQAVVEGALRLGARLAEPGEFTQRAFHSGRLDLTQAEAVHDLIAATTLHQARVAASQLGGALSRTIQPTKTNLVHLIAALEAGIDFAEDDLEVIPTERIVTAIATIMEQLAKLERSFVYGRALREGLTLAIVGRPNAGKSSLFNTLLDRDRSIVTAVPGTTRDSITEQTSIAGIPVEITDTAGIRDANDEIEALGIARSRETLAEAALVLLVVDGAAPPEISDAALLAEIGERPVLVALNKSDIADPGDLARVADALATRRGDLRLVPVSARTRSGVDTLRSAIEAMLAGDSSTQDSVFLTSTRQHASIVASLAELAAAQHALAQGIPHEMLLLHLHASLDALDAVTGTTTTEDVLNHIFSTFCIGK